jgi:hypothetical protein
MNISFLKIFAKYDIFNKIISFIKNDFVSFDSQMKRNKKFICFLSNIIDLTKLMKKRYQISILYFLSFLLCFSEYYLFFVLSFYLT